MSQSFRHSYIIMPWIVCGLGAIFYGYDYLLQLSPGLVTSQLTHSYGLSSAFLLGNLSVYYFYIYIPLQIPIGIFMDRYGVSRMLTLAAISCAIGAYFFANCTSLWFAEFGRLLIGFGSAFAFIGLLKLAIAWLPAKRFSIIVGLVLGAGMAASVLGELLFTELVKWEGWHYAYYFVAGFGLLLALIMLLLLRDGAKHAAKNAPISAITMKNLFLGMLGLLRQRAVWINGVVGCLFLLPLSAFASMWGIPYLEQVEGFSHIHAAGAMSLVFIGWAVGAPCMGWLSDRVKQRRVLLTTGATFSAILTAAIFYVVHISVPVLLFFLFVLGFFSSAQILVFVISKELSFKRVVGTSIAITNTFVAIGAFVSQPLIGKILDMLWSGKIVDGVHVFAMSDYQVAFSIIPLGLVLAVFLTFFLPETAGND